MRIFLSAIQQLLSLFLVQTKSIWQLHILLNYNLGYTVSHKELWPLPGLYLQPLWPLKPCNRHVIYHSHFTNTKATDLGSVYQRHHMLWEGGLKIAEMRANDLQSVSHTSTGPQQGVMSEHQSCPTLNWWGLSEKGSVYSPFYGEAKSRWRMQRTVSHLLEAHVMNKRSREQGLINACRLIWAN